MLPRIGELTRPPTPEMKCRSLQTNSNNIESLSGNAAFDSLVPCRLLPVCDKSWGRSLGTRLAFDAAEFMHAL